MTRQMPLQHRAFTHNNARVHMECRCVLTFIVTCARQRSKMFAFLLPPPHCLCPRKIRASKTSVSPIRPTASVRAIKVSKKFFPPPSPRGLFLTSFFLSAQFDFCKLDAEKGFHAPKTHQPTHVVGISVKAIGLPEYRFYLMAGTCF